MCTSKMIPRKWHIYNRFELITFITYIQSIGFSLLNTVIDSIGLPCAFGLVIFWYTIADSWRCRKYHIANSKLSVQFDSVQKTESYTLYIRVTIVPFEHMQIAQITINTFLIYLDIFEFRNYGILKNIHCHMESLFNPRNNI
jgi:riboflavin transporter FmnP